MINLIASLGFYPERIFQVNVLIGLIIIIIGVIATIFAKNISNLIKTQKDEQTKLITIKFIALAIVIVGCLVAVINI